MVSYLILFCSKKKHVGFFLGEVCIDALKQDGTWTATTTLDAAIIEVTKVIDNPRIDHIQHTGLD